ncbi:MAG: hypothetical protein WBL95_00685 [Microcoleus sp.]
MINKTGGDRTAKQAPGLIRALKSSISNLKSPIEATLIDGE